jgi:hypothetical protein
VTAARIEAEQRALCKRFGVPWFPAPASQKVGVSKDVRTGLRPISGLRHPPEGDTTGWYIWAGNEPSTDPDFFMPLHVEHLQEWCPEILKFLGLAPGWRFYLADGFEDVWEDKSLLDVSQ